MRATDGLLPSPEMGETREERGCTLVDEAVLSEESAVLIEGLVVVAAAAAGLAGASGSSLFHLSSTELRLDTVG